MQLKSYEVHRSSILDKGFPQDAEKGYSLYYYDTTKPSGYCILGDERQYEKERIYLGSTIGLLLSFVALGSPLTFYMIFRKFHDKKIIDKENAADKEGDTVKSDEDEVKSKDNTDKKVTEKSGKKNKKKKSENIRYFLWSVVATSFILVVLIIILDIYIFATNVTYYPHSRSEGKYMYKIFIIFCTTAVLITACFIVSAVLIGVALAMIKWNKCDKTIKDIPIPIPFKLFVENCLCCCRGNSDRAKICAESVALYFGTLVLTMFLQLSGFHIFFIILGVLATPINSISMFCFYIAFTFLSIAFVAILLKMSNTHKPFVWLVTFVIGVVGLASSITLILYYYSYIYSIDDNTYHSGALTILGHILPAAVTALLAFFGKNIISYIKDGGFSSSNNAESPSSSRPSLVTRIDGGGSSNEQEDNKSTEQGGAGPHGKTVVKVDVET